MNFMKKSMFWMFLIIFLAAVSISECSECSAESSHLRFAWDAVTHNIDDTPCTDLAGYAIYRSKEPDNWGLLTGASAAYISVAADVTFVAFVCSEPGIWFWIIRGFDHSGNYSLGPSEVIATDIDTIEPGQILNFRTCQVGDINCDGDVNGSDLVRLGEAFGGTD